MPIQTLRKTVSLNNYQSRILSNCGSLIVLVTSKDITQKGLENIKY
jgi:hypothetical protein